MKQEKENFESEDEDLSSLIEVEESPEDKSHHPSGEKSSSSSPPPPTLVGKQPPTTTHEATLKDTVILHHPQKEVECLCCPLWSAGDSQKKKVHDCDQADHPRRESLELWRIFQV